MAIVVCQICGGKQFKNEAAYQQHAKDNKTHQAKALALRKTSTPAATSSSSRAQPSTPTLSPPQVDVNKPGYCKACKTNFGSTQNLQNHYEKGDARHHPKCLRCLKGFENHVVLDEHRKSAHPMVYCQKCKKYMYLEEWAKHQAECGKPPPTLPTPPVSRPIWSCPVCSAVERSEEDVKKHIVRVHPELCCYTCGLAFQSNAELSTHFLEHNAHPTCIPCGMGFRGNLEYEVHLEDKHEPINSLEVYVCETCDREFRNIEDLERHSEEHVPAPLESVPEWDEDEDPFHSESSAGSPSNDKGKGVDRGFPTKPERIVPRAGHTIPLVMAKSEEEFYSDASSDSGIEIASTGLSAPELHRVSSAPAVPTVLTAVEEKAVILDKIVASPEPWTDVQLTAESNEKPVTRSDSEDVEVMVEQPTEARTSTSSSPVLVQEADAVQTDSPRSSATNSTSYHSAGRAPSPNRAISRLSLYTAYRHPSGDSPAPESSSGVASPASARSLLFTLSQSMQKARAESPKSRDSSSIEDSPKLTRGSSPVLGSTSGPSTSPRESEADVLGTCAQQHVEIDRTATVSVSIESATQTDTSMESSSELTGSSQSQMNLTTTASPVICQIWAQRRRLQAQNALEGVPRIRTVCIPLRSPRLLGSSVACALGIRSNRRSRCVVIYSATAASSLRSPRICSVRFARG
ncbi:hypothetical protein BDY19DRAFT_153407 [Irpex rosettiformis]|uniref:Uncharacterized protein n=1 Tax=Irpex rosettiformis TaxID=378272 RepID=A0ACB8U3V2_9APHY|nr:hypothetical protein BDY19DRAFT_153407 [Irpex rosettiformis]